MKINRLKFLCSVRCVTWNFAVYTVPLTIRERAVHLCVIIARYFYAATGAVRLLLHISPRFIPSQQKTWRRHCTRVLYYFARCSFHAAAPSSMQTAVAFNVSSESRELGQDRYTMEILLLPNAKNSKFKILHMIFQIPQHVTISGKEKNTIKSFSNVFSKHNIIL